MKKILFSLLAVMLIAGICYAEGVYNREPGYTVYIDAEDFTAAATPYLQTATYGNKILGFTFSDSSAGTVGLYDETSVATMKANGTTYLIGEVSVAAGTSETIMFPFPYKLVRGLVVMSNNSTGVLEVYYE